MVTFTAKVVITTNFLFDRLFSKGFGFSEPFSFGLIDKPGICLVGNFDHARYFYVENAVIFGDFAP